MGYRIVYPAAKKIRGVEKQRSRRAALTGLFVLMFLILVCSVWYDGKRVLQGLLFSGNADAVLEALEVAWMELREGERLLSAAEGFCLRILQGECG